MLNSERGLAPLKDAFKFLLDIRPWSVKDRLIDNGLFEDWKDREAFGQTEVFFEAEMWYRSKSFTTQSWYPIPLRASHRGIGRTDYHRMRDPRTSLITQYWVKPKSPLFDI